MYLNQFTNTKKFLVRALCPYNDKTLTVDICNLRRVLCVRCVCAHRGEVVVGAGHKEGKRIPSIFFFSSTK